MFLKVTDVHMQIFNWCGLWRQFYHGLRKGSQKQGINCTRKIRLKDDNH